VPAPAFHHRAGVRITGTILACDASGAAELAFVSHAEALPVVRGGAAHRARRPGRTQILTTPETLTLMGPRGERLRARALSPGFGRPFTLGFLRLELVPAGYQLGAAALLCDTGSARVQYVGPVGLLSEPGSDAQGSSSLGEPAAGDLAQSSTQSSTGDATQVRRCDALCIDATFADPRFVFLRRAEAYARILAHADDARARGSAPVFVVHPFGPAQEVAGIVRQAGWRIRADHAVLEASARYQACGMDVSQMARFSGALSAGEILLTSVPYPPGRRAAGDNPGGRPVRVAWLSEWAGDPGACERMGADLGIAMSRRADFAGVLRFVAASGAREVALVRAPSDALATELRRRRVMVYPLGPPRQIGLFDRTD
jgi:putative mRNA 3-end processing factor